MKSFAWAAFVAACGIAGAGSLHAQDITGGTHTPAATGSRPLALASGDTIMMTVRGSGPPVVLVPGLLGGVHTFRHVSAALVSAGHQVIVVEPLGTGGSARPAEADYTLEAQAERVLRALDEAGVESAVLVCHSVGGSICYRLALRAPERVRGIVSINGGPDEEAATSGLRRALKFAPLIRILGSGSMRGRLRDGLIDSSADPAWVTEETVRAYTAPFGDLGRALRGLRGMADAREAMPLAPRLADLDAPVTLLVGLGGDEDAVPPDVVAAMAASMPRLTVERVEGGGQYIQEERPGVVVDAVRALHRSALRQRP